jgi:tetratricopeptide (TPR) repeat protein
MALIPEGMAVEGVGNAAVNQEMFEEAVALSAAGDYAGAVAKYEEFMVANPHLDAVHGNIGNAYRDAGDVEKAREAYEKLLAAEPDNVMANYNMGEMFIEAGDMEEALPYFEAVLQQNPDDPAVYYNVAELYFSQQVLGCLEPVPECQGAISYYNRALETDPNYLPAHMQIGFALVRLGDIDNAVLAFEKYVELAPEDDAQLPIVKDVLAALKTG